jgi:hypothetical protein
MTTGKVYSFVGNWLRGSDLNRQPPGYEPDELPIAPPRDVFREKLKVQGLKKYIVKEWLIG